MMNYNDNLSVIYCRMAKIFHIFVFFLFPFFPVQAHPESNIPEMFPKITIHSVYNRLEGAADLFSSGNHVAAYPPYTLSDLKTIAAAFIAGAAATALQAGSKVGMLKNIIIASLLLLLAWLYFYFRQYQRKQRSRIRNMIRSHYQKAEDYTLVPDHVFSNISIEEVAAKDDDDLLKKRNESLMTSETEAKLMELLMAFEKGTLYNSKNMSLPYLAGELNTNTKYLSNVINRHKSSDFKSYINRLRINYIVDKLIHDEKYRQYKISILADECGFSSHSKFASVFKTVTDYSPSAFIKQLETDNDSFQENG